MNETLERFRSNYTTAMLNYLEHPVEKGLATAYQLGREAMSDRLSSLEIAEVHHVALTEALLNASADKGLTPDEILRIMKGTITFRLESLSTFEITQRGYFEAQQLYERERDVADSLRESLLPHSLPEIPGIEIEAYYRPGGSGNQVGGDFYDVFQADYGQWGVLLGDVCGKGAAAAAVTAMARHTARAAVLLGRHPVGVLRLVNQAFLNFGSDIFCTMIHGRVDKTASGACVTLATGGHPNPLKLSGRGEVSKIPVEGPLLGVVPNWSCNPATIELEPGDAVLLYTDGVTEARMPGGFFGDEGLATALQACSGFDAAKIVAAVTDALSEEKESPRRDDMAILAMRLAP